MLIKKAFALLVLSLSFISLPGAAFAASAPLILLSNTPALHFATDGSEASALLRFRTNVRTEQHAMICKDSLSGDPAVCTWIVDITPAVRHRILATSLQRDTTYMYRVMFVDPKTGLGTTIEGTIIIK